MQFDIEMRSKHKDLFLEIRDVLLSFDGVREKINTRSVCYHTSQGGLCHLKTTNDGVDVGFFRGIRMEDAYNMLWGAGKSKKFISLQAMNEEALVYYVVQALEINAGRQPR
ncbi:MAG: DUF1801 domain-containing protein [Rhodothermales bacterium]